jgi:hypothetical protein
MKRLTVIAGMLICLSSFAQEDVATLAAKLTSNCKTDKEKVTNIFRWITDNISYTTFSKQKKRKEKFVEVEDDDDGPLKPLNERVAELVLKRRTAFCDGYARLLAALCEYAGIRCEIICGYASGGMGRSKFGVNHYWNAVFLEEKWQLLDATWASGYIDLRNNEFVRNYNDRYFLTSPEYFMRDHYPDDPRWTLLQEPKLPEEFRSSPFRQRSFNKYGFTSFFPNRGIIEATVGDTIVLQLEAGRAESISPSTLTDSSLFSHSSSWVFLKPDNNMGSSTAALPKHQYTFAVPSTEVQWLYLLYNDDIVLRYKLNITGKRP